MGKRELGLFQRGRQSGSGGNIAEAIAAAPDDF